VFLCDRIEPYQSFGRNYQISLRVAIQCKRRKAARCEGDCHAWYRCRLEEVERAERVLAVAVTSAIMAVIVIGMVIV
jgi:hypothetical protein